MKKKEIKKREQKKYKKIEEERIQKARKYEKRRDIIFYSITIVLFFLIFVLGTQ